MPIIIVPEMNRQIRVKINQTYRGIEYELEIEASTLYLLEKIGTILKRMEKFIDDDLAKLPLFLC